MRLIVKLLFLLLFIVTANICYSQGRAFNEHYEPIIGWKKVRVGDTRILLELPIDFNLEPVKGYDSSNAKSFSCQTKYGFYSVTEITTMSGDTSLITIAYKDMLKRVKTVSEDATIAEKHKLILQGLPAFEVEMKATIPNSKNQSRALCLFIQDGGANKIWAILATSSDTPRAKSEANYLLSTIEIQDAPLSKNYPIKIYAYVEKMPQLPSGPGIQAIVNQIQRNFVYSTHDVKNKTKGRVFAKFIVTSSGEITDIEIIKGINSSMDDATISAIKKIGKLVPGEQAGRKAYVQLTLAINLSLAE